MKDELNLPGELLALLESLFEPRILVDPDYRILSAVAFTGAGQRKTGLVEAALS